MRVKKLRQRPTAILLVIFLLTSLACAFGGAVGSQSPEVRSEKIVEDLGIPDTAEEQEPTRPARHTATEEEEEGEPTRPPRSTATSRPTREPEPEPTFTSPPVEEEPLIDPGLLHDVVGWGGWGAGSDAVCQDGVPEVYFKEFNGSGPADIYEGDKPISPGKYIIVQGCYFPPGEVVTVTYYLPDGTSSSSNWQADVDGYWNSAWWSVPGEPYGEYEVYIESASGSASLFFSVAPAEEPVMTAACDPSSSEGELLLTGFVPGEEILLGWYYYNETQGLGNLEGYEHYTIEVDGTLALTIPNERILFVAYGSESPHYWVVELYGGEMANVTAKTYTELSPWRCGEEE